MRTIKSLLLLLFLALVGCSNDRPNRVEKFNSDWYTKAEINGIKNPYQVEEHIYIYAGYNEQDLENDNSPNNYCIFRIYSLDDEIYINDNSIEYLRQFDGKILKKNILYGHSGQKVKTTWIKKINIPNNIFNLLNLNLENFYNLPSGINPIENRFLECLYFFNDKNSKSFFINKYGLEFFEKLNKSNDKAYKKEVFNRTLNNPESLVRFEFYCSGNRVEFYDNSNNILINLSFQLPNKTYPNPSCSAFN